MNENKIRQTFYLTKDLKEKLRYLSYKENIKENDVALKALTDYFKSQLSDSDIKKIISLK